MALESGMQRRLVVALRSRYPQAVVRVQHGSRHSVKGDPDLFAIVGGHVFAIELKQAGKKPSSLQLNRLLEWSKAGAHASWFDSVEDALAWVEMCRSIDEGLK